MNINRFSLLAVPPSREYHVSRPQCTRKVQAKSVKPLKQQRLY